MTYRHTHRVPQPWAWLLPAPFLLIVLLPIAKGAKSSVLLWTAPSVLLALVVTTMFTALTATVADGGLEVAFRWGWPRRRIALADVTSVRTTTHGARYGWGIRLVPGGTLWRTWARNSVELTVAGRKRTFSIGTDDPEGLEAAIATAPRVAAPFEP